MTIVEYIGGGRSLGLANVEIGNKYFVEDNRIESIDGGFMTTITAEEIIKYFKLIK